MREERGKLDRGDGVSLAWAALPGEQPTVVFLSGLRSNMESSKALFLRDRCSEHRRRFLRFDYSGHGSSDGSFEEGTISQWTEDAAKVIDARAPGPLVLVGSSMGGWIALLLARAWGAERVLGLIGVSAAPDFTEDLVLPTLTPADQERLTNDGVVYRPSDYGEPMPITARMLRDGRRNLLLRAPLSYSGSVRLLQGKLDREVPWQHACRILAVLPEGKASSFFVEDGEHRLSRSSDLDLLWRTLDLLLRENCPQSFSEGRILPGDAE